MFISPWPNEGPGFPREAEKESNPGLNYFPRVGTSQGGCFSPGPVAERGEGVANIFKKTVVLFQVVSR
jgi:hypothetical protein